MTVSTRNCNGIDLHHIEVGSGDHTVVFSHSYLADHTHFSPQIEALSAHHRVLAFDHRDHGQSGRATTSYTMQTLVDDGIAFLEQTGAAPCHWVGLSTGGFVGMRIALQRPELLSSLVLMDTSAEAEPSLARVRYEGMLLALRLVGVRPLMGQTMKLMFGASSRSDPTKAELLRYWQDRLAANDPPALIRFGKAIFGRDSVLDRMPEVAVPTLVIVGAEDKATKPDKARRIAERVPGARLEVVPAAGHLSTLEQPEHINRLLADFLAGVSPPA